MSFNHQIIKTHILGLLSFRTLVSININPKLTFVQSMFSSNDMTPSTPEQKPVFQKLKSTS